jgi:hypothetical protein
MNQKIKSLIEGGFVTLADVLEYAQGHMTAVDNYDDEQIDKYYQGEYPQDEMTQEEKDWDEMRRIEDMLEYGQDDDMQNILSRPDYPEYIIASTVRHLEETLVFEADKDGNITSTDDYGGIAARWIDNVDWTDGDLAVVGLFGTAYDKINTDVIITAKGYYNHYKRNNNVNSTGWVDGMETIIN